STAAAGNNVNENLLFKREALELSLDTFKSDRAVETVTTLLPPFQQGTLAIIFKRSDLSQWVDKPLSSVLSTTRTLRPGQIPNSEQQRIDELEAGALFSYEAVQGPDGNAYFRLDPIG